MTTEYVFRAFDGKTFEDEDECTEYELTAGLPEGTKIENIGAYGKDDTIYNCDWQDAYFIVCHSAAELELFMRLQAQAQYAIPFMNNDEYAEGDDLNHGFIRKCHRLANEQSYPLVLEYNRYSNKWLDYAKETEKQYHNRKEFYETLLSIDNT